MLISKGKSSQETSNLADESSMGVAEHALVATCNAESSRVGLGVLKSGGSAIDAFIASTFVDYVVSPGITSMAGSLCLLSYNAQTKKIMNLHAGFKKFSQHEPFIPGAISGLWSVHQKQGKLPWEDLLQPAIALAQDGFPISSLYESILASRQSILHSPYAKSTFFTKKGLLKKGQILCQPLLAKTLSALANEGRNYFYEGAWAEDFANHACKQNKKEILASLKLYAPLWPHPWRQDYQGHSIYMAGPPSFGGVKLSLALRLLDFFSISKRIHWSKCADTLKLMICISRTVEQESWLYEPIKLNDLKQLNNYWSREALGSLAEKVLN